MDSLGAFIATVDTGTACWRSIGKFVFELEQGVVECLVLMRISVALRRLICCTCMPLSVWIASFFQPTILSHVHSMIACLCMLCSICLRFCVHLEHGIAFGDVIAIAFFSAHR